MVDRCECRDDNAIQFFLSSGVQLFELQKSRRTALLWHHESIAIEPIFQDVLSSAARGEVAHFWEVLAGVVSRR